MLESRTVTFKEKIPVIDGIVFTGARVTTGRRHPLAVIEYEVDGVKQRLGLRVDFGKGIIADHLDNEAQDAAAKAVLRLVSQQIPDYID